MTTGPGITVATSIGSDTVRTQSGVPAIGGWPPPSVADRRRTALGIATFIALTAALTSAAKHLAVTGISIEGLALVLAWCPAAAALLSRFVFYRTLRGLGWRWCGWKYALLGYCLPIAYAFVVWCPLWVAGFGDLHGYTTNRAIFMVGTILSSGVAQGGLGAVAAILVDGTVGALPMAISAFGEEVGWRGFLVPELAKITSFTKLSLISGSIWTISHYSVLVYHRVGTPMAWYGPLCFTVSVMGMSFVLAWLRLKTGSIWVTTIVHTSHNQVISIFDSLTRVSSVAHGSAISTDFARRATSGGLAIVLLLAAIVVWQMRDQVAGSTSAVGA
jgi:membrane protease YdiL (CAAX protease family)